MSSREWLFRIDDILNSITQIQQYTMGYSFEKFESDQRTIDAVVRNFEVLGEASRHIPKSIIEQYPDIPWRYMQDMRNLLIHEYFGVHPEIIWKTIVSDLPSLKMQIELLKKEIKN